MVKRGRDKLDDFYDMSEIKATRKYARALGDVYKNEGILAAAQYEIGSTIYSLGKRLANFFDGFTGPGPALYKPADGSDYYSQARNSAERIDMRTAQRKAYLLRWRNKDSALEKSVAVVSIISLIGSIFFLSPNLTGNVVGNMTNSTSNVLGTFLLFVGLIAGFFSLKKR